MDWRVSFPSNSGLNPFQAADLNSLHSSAFIVYSETGESGQFQGLPQAILSDFSILFKELPCRMECLSLGRNCYTTPFSKVFLCLSDVIQLTSNIVFWLYS